MLDPNIYPPTTVGNSPNSAETLRPTLKAGAAALARIAAIKGAELPASPANAHAAAERLFKTAAPAPLQKQPVDWSQCHTWYALKRGVHKFWPKAFSLPPKPLAIGINEELVAAGVPADKAEILLTWWVCRPMYLEAVAAPGSYRVNLRGEMVEDVSENHREWAKKLLAREEKHKAAAEAKAAAAVAEALCVPEVQTLGAPRQRSEGAGI